MEAQGHTPTSRTTTARSGNERSLGASPSLLIEERSRLRKALQDRLLWLRRFFGGLIRQASMSPLWQAACLQRENAARSLALMAVATGRGSPVMIAVLTR